nr:alpha/beta fold hydrolase [Sphingomicrobium sediminis]
MGNETSRSTEVVLTARSSDGVTVYGTPYYGDLPPNAPLAVLFHQGGGDARGEYAELAEFFHAQGFRAIAWDLRMGGDRFGMTNRTAAGLPDDIEPTYCNAYADVEAALLRSVELNALRPVLLVGSSYSGSLIFQAAAKNPDLVGGLLAFSPAGGGPVEECKALLYAEEARVSALVVRPSSESSMEEAAAFDAAGHGYFIAASETHGASILSEARSGVDVEHVRWAVNGHLSGVRADLAEAAR